jgi:hypothetical protein
MIICGIDPGKTRKYGCRCGFESDDIDDFATSCCWECVFPVREEDASENTSADAA